MRNDRSVSVATAACDLGDASRAHGRPFGGKPLDEGDGLVEESGAFRKLASSALEAGPTRASSSAFHFLEPLDQRRIRLSPRDQQRAGGLIQRCDRLEARVDGPNGLPRFGGLEGKVVSVAPDALLTPEGMPFYKVRIETDSSYFENKHLRYNLFPGVRVVANIHTGERTVLEYLLDPYLTRLSDAMLER